MKKMFSATPEQAIVIETWGQGLAVLAGAGCGKTTTLVRKCEELLRRNSEAKVIAVSFTERSASDLREKLATVIRSEKLGHIENHWVMTIHALCSRIAREFPGPAGLDGEERVLDEVESQALLRRIFESLWYLEVPEAIAIHLSALMQTYSRDALESEVLRLIDIAHFGAVERLKQATQAGEASLWLSKVAEFVIERYQSIKKREAALDFNDLESAALSVLRDPEASRTLKARFDLVLVDEFQDTNPIQCEIVRRLARDDFSNLVVVGDPKQSIYRFRDADVALFEEFCRELPVQVQLTRNYRSDRELIAFTNAVCAPIFSARKMNYEPLIATRVADTPSQKITWIESDSPAPLAEHILSAVRGGARFGDFAILLQRVRGSEKLLEELLSSGIPVALGSGGIFWSEPRVIEMVAFLRAWVQPENQLAAATALRAPWIGVSDAILDAWATEAGGYLIERFVSKGEHSVAKYLQSISKRTLRPGEVLQGLLSIDAVENELGFVLVALWHRLEAMSAMGWTTIEVLDECERAIETGKRDALAPPPASLGQVTVLTVHSSKGLEFDRVILPDLEKRRFQASPTIYWDHRKGIHVSERDETGARVRDSTEEEEWKGFEREKALDENLRLFYVALTRAKNELVFFARPEPEPEAEMPATKTPRKKKETAPSEQLNWKLWLTSSGADLAGRQTQRSDQAARDENAHAQTRDIAKAQWQRRSSVKASNEKKRPRHSVTELLLLKTCEKAYHYRVVDPVLAFEVKSDTGADVGTEVHFALSKDRHADVDRLVPGSRFSSWSKTAIALMAESDLDAGREVFQELPFEYSLGGEGVVGVIDRLVVQSNRIDLIDFKVTQGSASAEDLRGRYERQMRWYAFAVEKLIPQASERLRAVLLQISGDGVKEIEVFKGRQSFDDLEMDIQRALELIRGEKPQAKPGTVCRYCEYRSVCPDRAR